MGEVILVTRAHVERTIKVAIPREELTKLLREHIAKYLAEGHDWSLTLRFSDEDGDECAFDFEALTVTATTVEESETATPVEESEHPASGGPRRRPR